MGSRIFKKLLPHIIALAGFALLSSVYFFPQFEGKNLTQTDVINFKQKNSEVFAYEERHGVRPLWTNAMFGGMPTYQMSSPQRNNFVKSLMPVMNLALERPAGMFVAALISSYILFLIIGLAPLGAFVAALFFGFTTNNVILVEAGHNTKLLALAYTPLIIGGLILLFRKKYFLGAALFALGMGLNISANHVQMTYYLYLGLIFLFLFELIRSIRKNELIHYGKVLGFVVLGIALALGTASSKLWTTYEYSKDTMRGDPILQTEASQQTGSSSETEGLSWEYAMQWSNGFIDLVSTFIPGAAGGGSQEKVDGDSEALKDLAARGVNVQSIDSAPLYWGALPFTSGPPYFGATVWLLFILGLMLLKSNLRWWVLAAVLFTILISMGKHFALLNQPLFDYFPLFNKFRAPNSILGVTAVFMAVLAGAGLRKISRHEGAKLELLRAVRNSFIALGGISLFFALLGPSFFSLEGANDATISQQGWNIDAIREDRAQLLRGDAFRTFIFLALSAGVIFAYLKNRINKTFLIAALGILTIFDLWMIDKRYLSWDDFRPPQSNAAAFEPRPVDQQILAAEENGRGHYRVLDLSINTFNSARASAFHNTVGGYHAAKLQRYQDLIDHHISTGNQEVLDMLNTKYVINREGNVQAIPSAHGTAWFVNEIEFVNSPGEEIQSLNNLNTERTAIVLKDQFSDYIDEKKFEKAGEIELVKYEPVHLVYESNAPDKQFAVFSEIWYGPDKGWKAYIDGEEVEHIRVNYALRGMYIPAGKHEVEFKFHPNTYYTGEKISLASSLIILLGFFGIVGYKGYHYIRHELPAEKSEQPTKKQKRRVVKRKKPKRKS